MDNFREELNKIRESRKMSVSEMAASLNLAETTYYKLMKDTARVPAKTTMNAIMQLIENSNMELPGNQLHDRLKDMIGAELKGIESKLLLELTETSERVALLKLFQSLHNAFAKI